MFELGVLLSSLLIDGHPIPGYPDEYLDPESSTCFYRTPAALSPSLLDQPDASVGTQVLEAPTALEAPAACEATPEAFDGVVMREVSGPVKGGSGPTGVPQPFFALLRAMVAYDPTERPTLPAAVADTRRLLALLTQ